MELETAEKVADVCVPAGVTLDGPWAAVKWTWTGAPGMFEWNCILFERHVRILVTESSF